MAEDTAISASQRVDEYLCGRVVELMRERSEVAAQITATRANLEAIALEEGLPHEAERDREIAFLNKLEKRHADINSEVETLDLINQLLRGKVSYVRSD